MFWLARRPYSRWAAAALIIGAALAGDLRRDHTEPRPFANRALDAGEVIDADSISWRQVPSGLLPDLDPVGLRAAVPLADGEPLTPAVLTVNGLVPDGWWSIELELPAGAAGGMPARLVIASDPPIATPGIVAMVSAAGPFDGGRSGLVAVPAEHADAIARASLTGRVAIMVEAAP